MNITLIDGNSVGYAAHYGTTLKAGDQQTQAIFGVARTLIDIKTKFPQTKPIVLWDGRAQWRFDACPTYKSNRYSDDPKHEAIREAYKTQVPHIKAILKAMGVTQMQSAIHEADDLAGLLVKVKKPEDQITLLTGDRDWLQLVRPGVFWKDTRTGDIVTTANFFDYTGFMTPEAFLDGKCLQGDKSDVVPGVGGIGEKRAKALLAQFQSVENFFKMADGGTIKVTSKPLENLLKEESREIYRNNLKVMSLFEIPPIDKTKMTFNDRTTKNRKQFVDLCGQFAFNSFLTDVDGILKLF